MDYKLLQNGSDIRGVALDGVAGEAVNLTEQIACDIAAAFARWLRQSTKKENVTVAVGTDSRLSASMLAGGVMRGLSSSDVAVVNCGMASTPAMFMSTILPDFNCDGGIMITASHLPFNRNGLKFFTKNGGLEHHDIDEILSDCRPQTLAAVATNIREADVIASYSAYLRDIITRGINHKTNPQQPLSGFKIAVDAGNGAGGFFATQVLAPLGADVSASQFLQPDGNFPNHQPNPENKQAMASISECVLRNKCDLGIIFDTDVDRAAAVDSNGVELSRNKLIAVMASIVAKQSPHSIIVTDSVTSSQLADFITDELGCTHHRFKRGYKNVINEAIRLDAIDGNVCELAIETSGHGALKENYFLDDGAYISAKIIIEAVRLAQSGSSLGDLLQKLNDPAESCEYRIKINDSNFGAYGNEVLTALVAHAQNCPHWQAAPDNHEGYRATVTPCDGWFLLRMSLHDPILPLNIESNQQGGAAKIAAELKAFLANYSKLDLTCFAD